MSARAGLIPLDNRAARPHTWSTMNGSIDTSVRGFAAAGSIVVITVIPR